MRLSTKGRSAITAMVAVALRGKFGPVFQWCHLPITEELANESGCTEDG